LAEESYPDDLKYHAEHDWARVEGDVATFGITWFAQDQLGEVVFFDYQGRDDVLVRALARLDMLHDLAGSRFLVMARDQHGNPRLGWGAVAACQGTRIMRGHRIGEPVRRVLRQGGARPTSATTARAP